MVIIPSNPCNRSLIKLEAREAKGYQCFDGCQTSSCIILTISHIIIYGNIEQLMLQPCSASSFLQLVDIIIIKSSQKHYYHKIYYHLVQPVQSLTDRCVFHITCMFVCTFIDSQLSIEHKHSIEVHFDNELVGQQHIEDVQINIWYKLTCHNNCSRCNILLDESGCCYFSQQCWEI